METLKLSIILFTCYYYCTSVCHPLEVTVESRISGSPNRDSEDVLSRVTRKSVFIAPRLFHAQGIIKCPQGFIRTVANNCVEIIEPSPKAFENVLLERLKSIDYDYEDELIATSTSFYDETTTAKTTSENYLAVRHPRQRIQNRVSGSLSEYLSEVTEDSARITTTTQGTSTTTTTVDWSSGSTTNTHWAISTTAKVDDMNGSKTITSDVTSTSTSSYTDLTTNIVTTDTSSRNPVADSNRKDSIITSSTISNSETESTASTLSTTSSITTSEDSL